jgi:hypothetical protein
MPNSPGSSTRNRLWQKTVRFGENSTSSFVASSDPHATETHRRSPETRMFCGLPDEGSQGSHFARCSVDDGDYLLLSTENQISSGGNRGELAKPGAATGTSETIRVGLRVDLHQRVRQNLNGVRRLGSVGGRGTRPHRLGTPRIPGSRPAGSSLDERWSLDALTDMSSLGRVGQIGRTVPSTASHREQIPVAIDPLKTAGAAIGEREAGAGTSSFRTLETSTSPGRSFGHDPAPA